ncbi:MAG: ankyrin repeat domain-containing protein [Pseudomonadota bacterium]
MGPIPGTFSLFGMSFAVLPLCVIALVVAIVLIAVRLKGRHAITPWFLALIAVLLAFPALIIVTLLTLAAGLGHSRHPESQAALGIILVFLVMVVCPVAGLWLYEKRRRLKFGAAAAAPVTEVEKKRYQDRLRTLKLVTVSTLIGLVLLFILFLGSAGLWPPLAYAVRNDHPHLVRLLVDLGSNPNQWDRYGFTPLSCAASKGDRDMVTFLLERGADINGADPGGHTALAWALFTTKTDMARFLLEKGADPNPRTGGPIPLVAAIRDPEMVKLLLDKGANPDAKNIHGTPVTAASENDYLESLRILSARRPNLDATDVQQMTALMKASAKGHLEIVKLLLDNGADPRIKSFVGGRTALSLAEENRHHEIAQLIKARLSAFPKTDEAPAAPALSIPGSGLPPVAQPDTGAPEDMPRAAGPPIVSAVISGNYGSVKSHLDSGADVNARDEQGMTLLMLACKHGRYDVAKLLIERGAILNAKDQRAGAAALDWAITKGRTDIVGLLLDKGADPNIKSRHNATPLIEAANWGVSMPRKCSSTKAPTSIRPLVKDGPR